MDSASGSRPTTAEDFTTELDHRPELADNLRRGSIDALAEYFQLGGGKIKSITVRQLAQ